MHTKITTVTAILLSLLPSITLAAKDGEPVFNIRSALVNKDSVSVSLVRIEESPDQNLINCKIEGLGFQSATQLDLPCTGEQTETRYLRAWVQLPRRIAGGPNEAYPAFHIYGVNFIFEAEGGRHGRFESKGPLDTANGEYNWQKIDSGTPDVFGDYVVKNVAVVQGP